ncbi:androgen-induced gene 1 protein isoform X1 [Misgurnus anguillicaudatus]|uniref:androgen-induced gene 1 protein isoform X1 n=1 Tax=Misgurnus anguillicaudatus TaxID=75329 RepID=UPI002434953D|nr:androgen-induced gene 1 protein isoform X3 [Misgurnus anguillicaudatus]
MALIPSQILRVAILLSYFSILCNYKAIDMPAHQTYGGSWKFLTFIDLVIQAVFFGVCVLTDLSSLLTKGSANMEQERQLRKLIGLRDWIMAVLAFPVGVRSGLPKTSGQLYTSVAKSWHDVKIDGVSNCQFQSGGTKL